MIPREPDYLLDEPPREEPDDDECECDDLRCPECWERVEYQMDTEEMMPITGDMLGDGDWPL